VICMHEVEFGLLYDRSVWEYLMMSKEWGSVCIYVKSTCSVSLLQNIFREKPSLCKSPRALFHYSSEVLYTYKNRLKVYFKNSKIDRQYCIFRSM
jgi:hypothetical protein